MIFIRSGLLHTFLNASCFSIVLCFSGSESPDQSPRIRVPVLQSPDQVADQYNLKNQNQGHADHKIPMLGFVTEYLHTQIGADGATQNSKQEKGTFRDSPFTFLCLLFVNHHGKEACQINQQEINQDCIKYIFVHNRTSLSVRAGGRHSTLLPQPCLIVIITYSVKQVNSFLQITAFAQSND